MKRLKYIAAFVAIAAVSGAAVAALSKLSFWTAFAMSAVAIFANGLIATVEDDAPGGFNNPDGSATPAYVSRISIVLKVVAGVLALVVVVAVGYRLVGDWSNHAG